jgi:hypothetical protein
MQAGQAGEDDVIGDLVMPNRAVRAAAMAATRDLRRDWRCWSATERVCAVVLGGLWAVGLATAMLLNAHSFQWAAVQ